MFFNHRKTCAALQPPPGLGPADIAMQSSICTGETIIGFRQPGTDRLLQAVVVHRMLPIFIVLMGFLLRKERIPSRAPFDIVLSISPDIFCVKRMNFCVFSQFRLFLRKKHMFCPCTICK